MTTTWPLSQQYLRSVQLTGEYEAVLAVADERATGDALWRRRKHVELQTVLALCQEAPYRLRLLHFDPDSEALRAIVCLSCPVALQPVDDGALRRADGEAALGLVYPRELLLGPLPGTACLQLLRPREAFHPNVASGFTQTMCLGATLPRGLPLVELLVLAYASLAMQIVRADLYDPAGVLNPEAARYFEANPAAIPLTNEPFLRDPPGCAAESPTAPGGAT